jgi:glucose-1-phosphate cytidylyltransferase
MKVVILAGGYGTRLSEETEMRPKPLVEIGGRPILWHILKYYAQFGYDEFYLALGYKGEQIKRYFIDYYLFDSDITVKLIDGEVQIQRKKKEDWTLHLIDTGTDTLTGGRLKRLAPFLQDGPFMLTYGDGVANVNLNALVALHHAQGKWATVTAVRPPARFGGLVLDGPLVSQFTEKPQIGEGWINGGFMVLEPDVFDLIAGDESRLEQDVLEPLAGRSQLAAYEHGGFWQCMDTLRDKHLLESLWQGGTPPWKAWS